MRNIFFIHSIIDGHPGCFWFRLLWPWLSNALSWDEVSFGYTPKTYVCAQLLGAQHWLPLWPYRFALPPTMDECCPYPTCQRELSELSLVFLILAVLTGVRWNLKAVLIRISPGDLRMLSVSLFLGHLWLLFWRFCLDMHPIFTWVVSLYLRSSCNLRCPAITCIVIKNGFPFCSPCAALSDGVLCHTAPFWF